MKNPKYLFIIPILFFLSCSAPKLVGPASWSMWKKECEWKDTVATGYRPDSLKMKKILSLTYKKDIHYMIYAGRWCSDSETELPKLMQLLESAQIGPRNYYLIGVNKSRSQPENLLKDVVLDRIPTLVIKSGRAEIGRIVEHPKLSWED